MAIFRNKTSRTAEGRWGEERVGAVRRDEERMEREELGGIG